MIYAALKKQIQDVSEEYLQEIADSDEYILDKINQSKTDASDKDLSAYFGTIRRTMNGLEIQREIRNDWN